jgi:hypothetical protein
MTSKKYIYNWEQAYFYMMEGKIRPIESPQVHFGTGNIFFVFDGKETENIYIRWLKHNK